MTDTGLTKQEKAALESYDKKLQRVRDTTRLVASGHGNGYYCWGHGGIGKSYHMMAELKVMNLVLGKDWILHNTRLAPPPGSIVSRPSRRRSTCTRISRTSSPRARR